MNPDIWRQRVARLADPAVEAAVIVQCGLDWLRPRRLTLRNEVDSVVMAAQLRRGVSLRITRLVLHNLPAATSREADADAVQKAFDAWHYRLAATGALLSGPAPRIHRLIIRGDQTSAPVPDMVELLEGGRWSDRERASQALHIVGTAAATTPLTSYDVDLAGPFGDGDPSVHM
ncbi:hypothetical protein GCM10020367_24610 [Streptomyces sannanensis]|uniref:Uncharacterized protein n=1 Tax=Streptomyces sannanensis TaxID=285536 RepID=A0ABP6SA62_9ACTN